MGQIINSKNKNSAKTSTLTILCLGVVYGDIGTSPLYAFRQAVNYLSATGGVLQDEVIGILSLIIWALLVTATLKYVIFLLKFDNNGEGGILSLVALAKKTIEDKKNIILMLGITGTGLFFADAAITPAISVLSAIEGITISTPGIAPMVLPVSIIILTLLFVFQSNGTTRLANFFGPIMTIWFIVIGLTGFIALYENPVVLLAFSPFYAITFLFSHGVISLLVLGAVFLTITGAEALYLDLGHFGKKPIRNAWVFLVFPALVLNYLGQGALVLKNPNALANPFFFLVAEWAVIPMVILATLATIIASQAVITGAFSIARQAVQLNLLPRMEILHTSSEKEGQIYLPKVNLLLYLAVMFLCVTFKSSEKLASAYGIAVSAEMIITTFLVCFILYKSKKWKLAYGFIFLILLIIFEAAYLSANVLKIFDGGLIPLLFAVSLIALMYIWTTGTRQLVNRINKQVVLLSDLASMLEKDLPQKTPGTAIFLSQNTLSAPLSLTHNLKHNKVLHEFNIVLSITTANTPRVEDKNRLQIQYLNSRIICIIAEFGYMEIPNVTKILALARDKKVNIDPGQVSFFISRRYLRSSHNKGLKGLKNRIYIALFSSAAHVTDYYKIPHNRVIELGAQITI